MRGRCRAAGAAWRARGQALVPVVFVMMIVTAFAVTLAGIARREIRAAGADLRRAKMYYIARGAVQYAASYLQAASSGGATYPGSFVPPDTDANGWSLVGDGWFKMDVQDTAARVNINTAAAEDLARLPGLSDDPSLAAAIVDWRDSDDVPTSVGGATGAELEYYTALTRPYAPKNAPFDTVDELLLVRGMSATLLYGLRDASGSLIAPSDSDADALGSVDTGVPLCELLTVFSRELNVAADGSRRINVRTASPEELVGTLGLPPNLVQRLVQARGNNGQNLTSIAGLLDIPGFTRQIMQQIGDRITVTDNQYRDGVINVNTAPAEVLATIPNVDQTIYNAIIEARRNGTVFSGLNDLFQLTSLNRQQLQTLVDNVCTKSSVYLVRVKVRVRGSTEIRAYSALVEVMPSQASGEDQVTAVSPRIYQFREVGRNPGWASWTTGAFATGGSIGI